MIRDLQSAHAADFIDCDERRAGGDEKCSGPIVERICDVCGYQTSACEPCWVGKRAHTLEGAQYSQENEGGIILKFSRSEGIDIFHALQWSEAREYRSDLWISMLGLYGWSEANCPLAVRIGDTQALCAALKSDTSTAFDDIEFKIRVEDSDCNASFTMDLGTLMGQIFEHLGDLASKGTGSDGGSE